ncbi:MAG: alkaline phosphatase family protein [Solirubrobacterales bacterium]|nr:alkaline phosphatase family protein [Solirubrobacterales bacterium]
MGELILGPILRYVAETEATVWVETDRPCEVEVLGCSARTFQVEGNHYAIVSVSGLESGSVLPYEVRLDGEVHWPLPDTQFPPSTIRTPAGPDRLRVAFGSCRVALPHEAPYVLPKDEDAEGRGPDALYALAERLRELPTDRWPDVLVMIGDQIYADEVSPGTREFIKQQGNLEGPHAEEVTDFSEFRHLYLDSWGDPTMRWLLSVVPSTMIFDDHDVRDDWNTSWSWLQEMRDDPWWQEHIVNALASYWVYQHIGNLSPAELAEDDFFSRIREAEDGAEILREFAGRADRDPTTTRWSYHRDFGRTRLVVVDSRASRVLEPGHRSMLDEEEWAWLEEVATGDFDHLLIASSLPVLLTRGMHDLEAWNEAVCDGAWGWPGKKLGERVRQAIDLEHWAAFERSFDRMAELLEEVAAGRRGKAPASIVMLSGDVHHAYLAEVAFRPGVEAQSSVFQAVCSPLRNGLNRRERAVIRFASSRTGQALGRLLAKSSRVGDTRIQWSLAERQPWFENQVAQIELDGTHARIIFERAPNKSPEKPRLELGYERQLN